MPLPTPRFVSSQPTGWASMNPFASRDPPPRSPRPIIPYGGYPRPSATTQRPPTPRTPMSALFRRTTTRPLERNGPSTPRTASTRGGGSRMPRPLKKKKAEVVPERDWRGDLYDCLDPCDCSNCMLATCCPCILYGNNKRRFDHLTNQGYPHPELAATTRRKQASGSQQQEDDNRHQGCLSSTSEERNRRAPALAPPAPGTTQPGHSQPMDHRPQNAHGPEHPHDHAHAHAHVHAHSSTEPNESQSNSWFTHIFSPPCLSHALCAPLGVGIILQAMHRTQMRAQYHIRGEKWRDGCTALFCGPCALIQEAHELKEEEEAYFLDLVRDDDDARQGGYYGNGRF